MGLLEGKAALGALNQCIALESQEFGISASSLNPGNTQVDADLVAGRHRDET